MYYSVGIIIKQLRKKQEMSQEKLVEGIMTRENLSKIENGLQVVSKENLDAFLERLGYSSARFFPYALSDEEHIVFALREELDNHLARLDIDKASGLIATMEELAPFKKGLHRQYLLKNKAIACLKKEKDLAKVRSLLDEAIKITIPDFQERLVNTYLLATCDIEIIQAISEFHHENGDTDKAIYILEKLAQNIRNHVVDARSKVRALTFTLYSLSSYLGEQGKFNEALGLCNEAIEAGRSNRVYGLLPMLAFNKAYCLFHLGQCDKVKGLLHEAYFTCINMGLDSVATTIKEQSPVLFQIDITV